MTGLLLGILLARTVSGLVAQAAGWRAIYWLSAGLMLCFAVVLWRALPTEGARPHHSYPHLVGSSLKLLATEPVLRRRAWHGACAFAMFSVLWTTLAFLLSGSPYRYSNAVIGLFGLVGAGGILAANLAGKLADSARVTATTVVAGLLLTGSFALLWAGHTSLAALDRRDRGPRHRHPGHADHKSGRDLCAAPRCPQSDQQRLHGLLLHRRRGGLGGGRRVYGTRAGRGVCVLGAAFGLGTLGLSVYDRVRPARQRAAEASGAAVVS